MMNKINFITVLVSNAKERPGIIKKKSVVTATNSNFGGTYELGHSQSFLTVSNVKCYMVSEDLKSASVYYTDSHEQAHEVCKSLTE